MSLSAFCVCVHARQGGRFLASNESLRWASLYTAHEHASARMPSHEVLDQNPQKSVLNESSTRAKAEEHQSPSSRCLLSFRISRESLNFWPRTQEAQLTLIVSEPSSQGRAHQASGYCISILFFWCAQAGARSRPFQGFLHAINCIDCNTFKTLRDFFGHCATYVAAFPCLFVRRELRAANYLWMVCELHATIHTAQEF